jgi:hypothetical protein
MRGIVILASLMVLSAFTPPYALTPADLGWQQIGYANEVVAMAAMQGKIYAASRYNKLWIRDPTAQNIRWRLLGSANRVRALAAVNGKLFGATEDHKLWMRDPVVVNAPWQHVGYADAVIAMAALEGRLYAATRGNKLLVSSPDPWNIRWQQIGDATQAVALAGVDGKLLAVTKDHKLMMRDLAAGEGPWQYLGNVSQVTALTALDGKLFAATPDNKVWMGSPLVGLRVAEIALGTPDWVDFPDVDNRVVVTITFHHGVTPPSLVAPSTFKVDLKGLTSGRTAAEVRGSFRFSADSRTAVFISERTLAELIRPETNETIEYRITLTAPELPAAVLDTAVGDATRRSGEENVDSRMVKVLRKPYMSAQQPEGRVF